MTSLSSVALSLLVSVGAAFFSRSLPLSLSRSPEVVPAGLDLPAASLGVETEAVLLLGSLGTTGDEWEVDLRRKVSWAGVCEGVNRPRWRLSS